MKKYIAPLKHIFTVTDRLINSTDFLDRHRVKPTAFTRNRKMPFVNAPSCIPIPKINLVR